MHHHALWHCVGWLGLLLGAVNGQLTVYSTSTPSRCGSTVLTTPTTTTISRQSEASALASLCPTYGATINIHPDAPSDLTFAGLEVVYGDIIIKSLTYPIDISFPALRATTSFIWLINGTNFVNFSNLTRVKGVAIQNFDFAPSIGGTSSMLDLLRSAILSISNTLFVYNTTLTEINFKADKPDTEKVDIQCNEYLRSVKLGGSVSTMVKIVNNTHAIPGEVMSLDLTDLNSNTNLFIEGNQNITFGEIGGVAGNMLVHNNTGLAAVKLASWSKSYGSLDISNNPDLTQLSIPRLQSVDGDLRITGNNRLLSTGNFSNLSDVYGSITLEGPFDTVSFADTLSSVSRSFTVDASRPLSCDPLRDSLVRRNVLSRSAFSCRSTNETLGQVVIASEGNRSSNVSIGMVVGVTIAVIAACAIVATVIFCWWKRRRRQKSKQEAQHESKLAESEPLSAHDHYDLQEMWSDPASELATKVHTPELPSNERPTELSIAQRHSEPSLSQRDDVKLEKKHRTFSEPHELEA